MLKCPRCKEAGVPLSGAVSISGLASCGRCGAKLERRKPPLRSVLFSFVPLVVVCAYLVFAQAVDKYQLFGLADQLFFVLLGAGGSLFLAFSSTVFDEVRKA